VETKSDRQRWNDDLTRKWWSSGFHWHCFAHKSLLTFSKQHGLVFLLSKKLSRERESVDAPYNCHCDALFAVVRHRWRGEIGRLRGFQQTNNYSIKSRILKPPSIMPKTSRPMLSLHSRLLWIKIERRSTGDGWSNYTQEKKWLLVENVVINTGRKNLFSGAWQILYAIPACLCQSVAGPARRCIIMV
jgi:hypothetical protein